MRVLALVLPILIVSSLAKAQTPKKHIWLETEVNHLICWYDDKKYTLGAVIEVNDTRLICTQRYPNQENGPVAWYQLDKKGNIIYPKTKPKITVN